MPIKINLFVSFGCIFFLLTILSEVHSSTSILIGNGVAPGSCNFTALVAGIDLIYFNKQQYQGFDIVPNCPPASTILFTHAIWLYGTTITVKAISVVTLNGGGINRQFVIGFPRNTYPQQVPQGSSVNVLLQNLVLPNGGGSPFLVGRVNPDNTIFLNETVSKRDGGCINVLQGAALSLNDVTFLNCSTQGTYVPDPSRLGNDVTFMGGAIFMYQLATLTATGVSFINNTAGRLQIYGTHR